MSDGNSRNNNCYVNGAYNGYYDSYEEDNDDPSTNGDNKIVRDIIDGDNSEDDDDNDNNNNNNNNSSDDLGIWSSDDNETFVDEDYYRHRPYRRRNFDSSRSCTSLITLRRNYDYDDVRTAVNKTVTVAIDPNRVVAVTGRDRTRPRNNFSTNTSGSGFSPITSTPKKNTIALFGLNNHNDNYNRNYDHNYNRGNGRLLSTSAVARSASSRRRLISTTSELPANYNTSERFGLTATNIDTNPTKVDLERSKSIANIARSRKQYEQQQRISANSSFTAAAVSSSSSSSAAAITNYRSIPPSTRSMANFNNISIDQRRNNSQTFTPGNSLVRKPSDTSTICSTRPLISTENKKRNTAIISPIYSKQHRQQQQQQQEQKQPSFYRNANVSANTISTCSPTSAPYSSFQVVETNNNNNNNNNNDTSSPSSKRSWLQMSSSSMTQQPNVPLCTLKTCAVILLISGALNCFLCLRITMEKGRSYELAFAFLSSFVAMCLGFPCFGGFRRWQWLPNRNYVSGYVVLCLFSLLQTIDLWLLRSYVYYAQPAIVDIAKGTLWGVATLTLLVAVLGLVSSYCCKYPPPDNRVSHAVESFRV